MRTFGGYVVLWCGAALLFAGGVLVAHWFVGDVLHADVPLLRLAVAGVAAPLTLVPEYWRGLFAMVGDVMPVSAFLLLAGSVMVSAGVALVNVRFPRRPPLALRVAMKAAARRSAPRIPVPEKTVERRQLAAAAPKDTASATVTAIAAPVKRARHIRINVVRLAAAAPARPPTAGDEIRWVAAPTAWGPALAWRRRYLEDVRDFAAHQAEFTAEAQRTDGLSA